MISAPASGTGKTTVTLGLIAALRAKGLTVQPFKSGPDYIDPAFHAAAAGRPSVNLDSWAMPRGHGAGAGRGRPRRPISWWPKARWACSTAWRCPAPSGTGASADIAALMGWPVVLVLDVSGQAQSAAAVALGLCGFRPDLRVAGVVLNRVASPRHEALVRVGMAAAGIRVFGALPREPSVALPERHLGLVQAEEQGDLAGILARGRGVRGAPSRSGRAGGRGGRGASRPHAPWDIFRQTMRGCAARSAHRPGTGCGVFLRLSASARRMARGGGRGSALLAARRRGAGCLGRRLLAARGLSGTARRTAGCGRAASAPGWQAFAADAAGAWRMRRLHGAGRRAGRQGRACGTGWPGCWGWRPALPSGGCTWAIAWPSLLAPIPGAEPGARLRGHEFHYATILAQPDAPLAASAMPMAPKSPKPARGAAVSPAPSST